MSLEAWKTDQIYLNIVYLGYSIYPDIIIHNVNEKVKVGWKEDIASMLCLPSNLPQQRPESKMKHLDAASFS